MKLSVLLMALCLSLPTWAQAPSGSNASEPVSNATVEDFVNALSPQPRTRSLARNIKVEPARIDLTVNFDFDSARLQPESRPMLERLAAAMKTERLASLRFQIEGHTDAQGTARYNDVLSQRRAQAVVDFLTLNGVPMSRLESLGKGFSELLDAENPLASRNRRVRVGVIE